MLVPAANMKQDLLKQWLDTTGLERPSKRRRIDYTSEEEAASEPPLPLTPPKVHSDDYRQASKSATFAAWNQVHDEELSIDTGRVDILKVHGIKSRRTQVDIAIQPIRSTPGSAEANQTALLWAVKVQSPPGSVASIGSTKEPPPSVRTTDSGSENSIGSKQTRIDATSTNYRSDVLASNRVTFKNATTPLPVNVAAVVNRFVFEQGSSEMDDTTATESRDKIIQLGEDAEAELSHEFMTMGILPSKAAGKILKRVQQMPFTNAILPRAIIPDGLSVAIQTICEPKPDVASTVDGANLSKFSRLAKDLYWPFLVVEFNAPAVGGNIYVAENQSSQANDSADLIDSVAYSAAIDGAAANLLVHWYDVGDEMYCLKRIHHYDLNRPEDIQKFQLHTKNIVDWGVGSRLKKIRAALDVVLTEEMKKKQLKI
ncbi:MAG: hypothetical protein M1835_001783 [Candelina submexicana]|nr:MAG: hypothetical protein M1835_001783 [Candelina submexicana]